MAANYRSYGSVLAVWTEPPPVADGAGALLRLRLSKTDAASCAPGAGYGNPAQRGTPATAKSLLGDPPTGGSSVHMYTERLVTMSTHRPNSISDMMEQYAADAVRLASELGVTLDYSESSLEALERILNQLADKFPSSETELRSEDSMQKELDSVSRIWGGYFGETIRRLWGGEWGVETYPGTIAPVISVDIGGAKLFPVMKIYRRLTKDQDENVWRFYQKVRGRISEGRKQ